MKAMPKRDIYAFIDKKESDIVFESDVIDYFRNYGDDYFKESSYGDYEMAHKNQIRQAIFTGVDHMLHEEIEQYTKLTGQDGSKVPLIKLGAFLDGFELGKADAIAVLNELLTLLQKQGDTDLIKIKYIRQFAYDKFNDLRGKENDKTTDNQES